MNIVSNYDDCKSERNFCPSGSGTKSPSAITDCRA